MSIDREQRARSRLGSILLYHAILLNRSATGKATTTLGKRDRALTRTRPAPARRRQQPPRAQPGCVSSYPESGNREPAIGRSQRHVFIDKNKQASFYQQSYGERDHVPGFFSILLKEETFIEMSTRTIVPAFEKCKNRAAELGGPIPLLRDLALRLK